MLLTMRDKKNHDNMQHILGLLQSYVQLMEALQTTALAIACTFLIYDNFRQNKLLSRG